MSNKVWRIPAMTFVIAVLLGGTRVHAQTGTWQERLFTRSAAYDGAADTFIDPAAWATPRQYSVNYGQSDSLLVNRGGALGLIRFDLNSIPVNSSVQSAQLRLYARETTSAVRRIKLYLLLKTWDEGNQINGPIDAAGEHGATADHAFSYFTGEGTNVAWGARGLQAGSDYAATEIGALDVAGSGWYEVEIGPQVQQWVRSPGSNFGLALKDATGYVAGNPDYRSFHSSQYSDASRRPTLRLVYNPDTPLANAGSDITELDWTPGSAVVLDGSGSTQAAGISYRWSIVSRAPGSQLSDSAVPSAISPGFTPDVAGEYRLRLTVTNALGLSASDDVVVRLLAIPAGHPRLHLNEARLQVLRAQRAANTAEWARVKNYADGSGSTSLVDQALMYQVTGDATYGNRGVTALMNYIATNTSVITSGSGGARASTAALGYDWLYPLLSAQQKQQIIAYLKMQVEGQWSTGMTGWNNYGGAMPWRIGFAGLATYGDNPEAQAWIDHARYTRFENLILEGLKVNGAGGGWVEGSGYEFTSTSIFRYVDGVFTATGERLFETHPWFKDYLSYSLFSDYPAVKERYSNQYHDTLQIGDMEHNRETFWTYRRLIAEMAAGFFPDAPEAGNVQWYLQQAPGRAAGSAFAWEELIHWNKDIPAVKPVQRAHHAAGLGRVFMRSDFDSVNATHIAFLAGDHFTYHQDIVQGSFTVFKREDLAVRSGVYDGYGDTSPDSHLLAYNSRTIAGNSVLVCQEGEVFNRYRAGTTIPSDCGQTPSLWTYGNSPTIEQWKDTPAYNSADIKPFYDGTDFTYVSADISKAYNPSKLSRFTRQFAYARPSNGEEFVIVYDRVSTVRPEYGKKWLLHFLNEPAVDGERTAVHLGEDVYNGSLTMADAGQGRLFTRTLLPAAHRIRKIGGRIKGRVTSVTANSITDTAANLEPNALVGNTLSFTDNYNLFNRRYPITANSRTTITVDTSGYSDLIALGATGREYSAGRDYWVNGKNYPATLTDFEADYGSYRIEVEPAQAAADDVFLHVLFPTSTSVSTMPAAGVIETAAWQGALVKAATARIVLFSRDGTPKDAAGYSVQHTGAAQHLLTDLADGTYDVYLNAAKILTGLTTRSGVLSFSAPSEGSFQLTKTGELPDLTPPSPPQSPANPIVGVDGRCGWCGVDGGVDGAPQLFRWVVWMVRWCGWCAPTFSMRPNFFDPQLFRCAPTFSILGGNLSSECSIQVLYGKAPPTDLLIAGVRDMYAHQDGTPLCLHLLYAVDPGGNTRQGATGLQSGALSSTMDG